MSEPVSAGVRLQLERAMRKLPFVKWDRWAGAGERAQVFGWIARPDGRADFVLLESDGEGIGNCTSSAEYSLQISELLHGAGGEHNHCRRVEHDFPTLQNVARA